MLNPGRSTIPTNQGHVRNMNRPFFIQDAASYLLGRVRPRMALDNVDMLDVQTVATRFDLNHPHGIVLTDVEPHHQRTSGARETIFRNFFSRSSRATGPKTRVPTGSPASLINTAAFSSNRI